MTFLEHLAKRMRPVRRAGAPRRSRRGFSLPEMTLVLIVTAMIMQTGVELGTSYLKRQVTQRTAANISRVADDVETYMDRNYFELVADLSAAPNNVLEVDWGTLIGGNLISLEQPPVSPDGGELRLFFTLRSDTVYSVIMSFDGNGSNYSPRPDPSTKFAGKVQGHAPNRLNGWDFSLGIPEIANLTGEDLTGNIGVIRYVARDVNVNPYLHRVQVPGSPELNEMLADLDMGGFDITNTLTVTSEDLVVQDEMAVNGRVVADTIESTGDAEVGEMNADRVTSRELATVNATVSNRTQTTHAVAQAMTSGTFQTINASIGNLTADELNGGTVFLTTGNYIEVDVNRIDAVEVIADDVFIGD